MAKKKELINHGILYRPQDLPEDSICVGIDEVGRGCLAGPVVAGAVVFPKDFDLIGLDDSKKLTEKERLCLDGDIKNLAWAWGIGLVWQKKIDEINILQASLLAMARAVAAMQIKFPKTTPKIYLIDGTFAIPPFYLAEYSLNPLAQKTIIHGDALEPCISAASVIAKNFRDNLMIKMDKRYPNYGFASHKGYGTKEHRLAIQKYGPCPLHRMDFKSVRPQTMEQGSLC